MCDKKIYKWNWNVFPLDIKNFTVFEDVRNLQKLYLVLESYVFQPSEDQVHITQELRVTLFVVVRNALGLTNILLLLCLLSQAYSSR
jgi:hypothetical protein